MTSSLPTEIIQLILDQVRPDPLEGVGTALAISSISQHWRTVALCTPSLWSKLSFGLQAHADLLPAFFERSLAQPLDITVAFDITDAEELLEHDVQRTVTLLLRAADRVERLHLRFLCATRLVHDFITQFVGFRSSRLKFLEMESLPGHDIESHELFMKDFRPFFASPKEHWSDLCPALTHVTCTDAMMLLYRIEQITHLRFKEVPGRSNVVDFADMYPILRRAKSLREFVLDGVSLVMITENMNFPHLSALSVRKSLLPPDGYSTAEDTERQAFFLRALTVPALATLAIPEMAMDLPAWLMHYHVCFRSVTRFSIIPGFTQPFFYYYSTALPNVEEFVLLGSDPKLYGIAGLSADAWPHLHTIDLAELEPPPIECLEVFWERLHWYGQLRFEAGHYSRVVARLPRGITTQAVPLDVSEYMDVTAYY